MSTEREELMRYEAQDPQRPDLRFRVWTGEAGEILSGAGSAGAPESGSVLFFDLGRHEWVVKVEVDFGVAPGKYRVEYCCDLEGQWAEAALADIPEEAWIFLAAGIAETVLSLIDCRRPMSQVEEIQQKWHDQPPLFLRYLRVVSETTGVVAVSWRVYADSYIDLTDRIIGSVTVSRKTEAHRLGQFVRPTMELDLANEDGMLNLGGAPPSPPVNGGEIGYFDAGGVGRLHSYARGTLEVKYFGPNWESPQGLLGSGWWPVFCGERVTWRRSRAVEGSGRKTTVHVQFEGGTCLKRLTTQPLHELMGPNEFLRDWLTVTDDGQKRLCGIEPGRDLNKWVETSFEEFVGRTWAFGDNWREAVLSVEPPERIHAICSTGGYLVGITNNPDEGPNQNWWLVKWDFGGREIERRLLGQEHTDYPGDLGIKWYEPWMDLTYLREMGKIAAVKLRRGRTTDSEDGAGIWLFEPEGLCPAEGNLGFPGYGQAQVMTAAGICEIRGGPWDGYICVYAGLVHSPYVGQPDRHHFHLRDRSGHWIQSWSGFPQLGAFSLQADWGPMPKTMEFMGWEVRGGFYRLALTGGWKHGHRDVNNEPDTLIASGGHVRVIELAVTDAEFPVLTAVREGELRQSDYDLRGLAVEGDYVLAAGFGKDGTQEVAKVARLGWYLENALIRSESTPPIPPVNGGVGLVNFGEARIRVGGEILSAADYDLDLTLGHLQLKLLPENGLEVRASYDYEPTFGLVPVKKQVRWEIAGEVANAFGLVLRVDEIGRLSWRRRWITERFAFRAWDGYWRSQGVLTRTSWYLGQSIAVEGLPWIVPESIGLWVEQGMRPLTAAEYTLTEEEITQSDGSRSSRWHLAVATSIDITWPVIVVRFCVQETVRELQETVEDEEIESDAERVITQVSLTGEKRVPADFAQRIEQKFVLAPADSELFEPFDRMKAVEGSKSFDWKAPEKLFEESGPEERPQFNVPFDQPLLLGSSRWGVVCGKLPVIGSWSYGPGDWSGKRFLEVTLQANSAEYAVWMGMPLGYRLATAEDFEDMHGNTTGTEPISAEDVKTAGHFYVKYMNPLGSSASVLAYDTETRWYRSDEWGRLVRDDANAITDLHKTAYPEKAVLVMLRPQDLNGVPLFLENPGGEGSQAYVQIDSVRLTSEGLRISLNNPALRENYLLIEVVGHPVSAVEQFRGWAAADAVAVARYGEIERAETFRFLPNLDFAGRAARELILRRSEEPERPTWGNCLLTSLLEDELVWAMDDDGTRVLKRVVEVEHTLARERSGTRVTVE